MKILQKTNLMTEKVGQMYLRVDDERRVPRIAAALRPHKVERLEGDVDGGHSGIVLVATEIGILMEFVIAGGSGATFSWFMHE